MNANASLLTSGLIAMSIAINVVAQEQPSQEESNERLKFMIESTEV